MGEDAAIYNAPNPARPIATTLTSADIAVLVIPPIPAALRPVAKWRRRDDSGDFRTSLVVLISATLAAEYRRAIIRLLRSLDIPFANYVADRPPPQLE